MSIVRSILLTLLVIPSFAFAQQSEIPSVGITPSSPFYFLDRLSEALQEFFTMNPEGKVRLQIEFVKERASEIKFEIETDGIGAEGVDIAQSRLQEHVVSAATILKEEQSEGKDMSILTEELDQEVESTTSSLQNFFEEKKDDLESQVENSDQNSENTDDALDEQILLLHSRIEMLENHLQDLQDLKDVKNTIRDEPEGEDQDEDEEGELEEEDEDEDEEGELEEEDEDEDEEGELEEEDEDEDEEEE